MTNSPSQQVLDFSVDKIQEVKSQIAELMLNLRYGQPAYTASFKKINDSMDIAVEYHGYIHQFNALLKNMNDASMTNNEPEFATAFVAYQNLTRQFGLTEKLKTSKRKTSFAFKVSSPYMTKLIRSLDNLNYYLDNGKKRLAQLRRTPAQQRASEKASENMTKRWAE